MVSVRKQEIVGNHTKAPVSYCLNVPAGNGTGPFPIESASEDGSFCLGPPSRRKLSQSCSIYFTRRPKPILCKCRSDAVQGDALDLHSSSTVPSLEKRKRSQETGSEGLALLRGTKQHTLGKEER